MMKSTQLSNSVDLFEVKPGKYISLANLKQWLPDMKTALFFAKTYLPHYFYEGVAPFHREMSQAAQVSGRPVLIVSGGNLSEAQTFALKLNKPGTKWQVKKSTTSTPGGLTVDGVLPAGTTVTLVVRNPNGMESAPATLTR